MDTVSTAVHRIRQCHWALCHKIAKCMWACHTSLMCLIQKELALAVLPGVCDSAMCSLKTARSACCRTTSSVRRAYILTPFPGRSRLQFLIACSMQKRRGEPWEIESCARHQADVRGAMPDCCNSQTLCWSAWSLPNNKQYWHCLLNITSQVPAQDITRRTRDSLSGTGPLTSTFMSTWCHTCDSISQAFSLCIVVQLSLGT